MKICWDNLENIKLTKSGNFKKGSVKYIEKENCKKCGEPYLAVKYCQVEYCCIACSKLNKIISEETKKKISKTRILKGLAKGKNNPMYGKKFSLEHKRKMSEALKNKYINKKAYWCGKKLSEKHRKKISMSKKGQLMQEANPNWKGGISCEPYCDIWLDKEYKDYIKQRDENKCLNPDCRNNSTRLNIHHINYNKKDCQPNNLITLCASCNARANYDRAWHEAWYKAIIHKKYGRKKCQSQY